MLPFFSFFRQELKYEPFYADFGPLNLAQTFRFVTELDKLLKVPAYQKTVVYHFCSTDSAKRANAAYLMGAFQVIAFGKTAEESWRPFSSVYPPFADFRDASFGACSYKCTILDCLKGLEYAMKLGWFDVKTFDLRQYEYYEKVENGDLNWVVPDKFIAFSTPNNSPRDMDGLRIFTPEDYIPIFKTFDVGTVIRLNKPQYDQEKFIKSGIKHYDLYFLDGSTPSDVNPS